MCDGDPGAVSLLARHDLTIAARGGLQIGRTDWQKTAVRIISFEIVAFPLGDPAVNPCLGVFASCLGRCRDFRIRFAVRAFGVKKMKPLRRFGANMDEKKLRTALTTREIM
jgi:hypothetical protein